jgi:hypothetical protein
MNTNGLAILDEAIKATVAIELGEEVDDNVLQELGIRSERKRTVAGLTVVTKAFRDAPFDTKSNTRLDLLRQYRADNYFLKQKLDACGITAKASLPATAWFNLCNETKLFRFTPNADGAVRILGENIFSGAKLLTKNEMDAIEKKQNRIGWYGIITSLIIFAAIITIGWHPVLLSIVTAVVCFFVTGGIFGSLGIDQSATEAKYLRTLVDQYTEEGTLFEIIWPGYCEPSASTNRDFDILLKISLPTPPDDVQETLLKAERGGLELKLAVVGEAIALRENVADVLLKRQRQIQEEIERSAKLDPIVYIRHNTAIAIIDQYGDFPIEKAVMLKVINSEHLV